MITKIYIYLVLISLSLFLYSCENVMDIHKDFVENGEIIYATKPDSIYFVAGQNRTQLNYKIFNAPNVESIAIYWNDYTDSLIHPVKLTTDTVYGQIIIDDLEEKSYTFYVQTIDINKHRSLKLLETGAVYGNAYEATLMARKIQEVSSNNFQHVIKWYGSPSDVVRSEVRYTDKYNKTRIVSVLPDATEINCPDTNPMSSFEHRTLFIPEKQSVDTFYTEWVKHNVDFPFISADVDRKQWNVLFYDNSSTQEGSPQSMLDNNKDTYWHSDYANPTSYPYTFVIDMIEPIWINEVGAQSRQNNFYSKEIEFYISETNINPYSDKWFKIGGLELIEGSNDFRWSICPIDIALQNKKARYLKVVFTSGYKGNHLGAVSEIAVKKVFE